eukprot:scaffold87825_cov39-Tisochrysis_lutea.AAC.1
MHWSVLLTTKIELREDIMAVDAGVALPVLQWEHQASPLGICLPQQAISPMGGSDRAISYEPDVLPDAGTEARDRSRAPCCPAASIRTRTYSRALL